MLMGEHPTLTNPLKATLLQQTGWAEQEFPPTPEAFTGLQLAGIMLSVKLGHGIPTDSAYFQ